MPPLLKKSLPEICIEEEEVEGVKLTSGFLKYPSGRDHYLQNPELWLEGKKKDDDVYPYWRIHNKLYDLSKFVRSHPGGEFWIEATQGADITESFESSHFSPGPEELLKKYYVKDISTARNSPFSFHEDGFYKTLKRKASPILKKVGTGPSREMLMIQDSLLSGFIFFAVLATLRNCYWSASFAGAFLALAGISAHNFFHQRDSWRMIIFDNLLMSSREWRISHALSHHVFPNTIYDYEISAFEPHLQLLPKEKNFMERYGVLVTVYILYAVGLYIDKVKKGILMCRGKIKPRLTDFIPTLQLILMATLSSSYLQGFTIWLVMHTVCNFIFMLIGLTASHHHPEIYREGDNPHPIKDWGLHQISTTRERGEVFMSSLFLAAVSFGNHTLHHLFPTVDHSKLHYLQPLFLETCKEFGIKFKVIGAWELYKGFFGVLAATKPNKNSPVCFK